MGNSGGVSDEQIQLVGALLYGIRAKTKLGDLIGPGSDDLDPEDLCKIYKAVSTELNATINILKIIVSKGTPLEEVILEEQKT